MRLSPAGLALAWRGLPAEYGQQDNLNGFSPYQGLLLLGWLQAGMCWVIDYVR